MEASEYVAWNIDVPLDSEECIADTPRYDQLAALWRATPPIVCPPHQLNIAPLCATLEPPPQIRSLTDCVPCGARWCRYRHQLRLKESHIAVR
jgi:hypothetical protein